MFALGTSVAYTHRAGVARKRNDEWYLPAKGNGEIPKTYKIGNGTAIDGGVVAEHIEPVTKSKWSRSEESIAKRNKSVLSWPQEGSGVIVGLETKQVGVSEVGSGSYGPDGDYEQGYFTSHGNVDLYVVRSELRGKRFVYVPTWAVRAQ